MKMPTVGSIDPESYALRLDPRHGLVMPWYTHGALDELASRDWSDKTVLEWGGGCSTLWWSRVAHRVYTVETSPVWVDWIKAGAEPRGFCNISVELRWPEPLDEYLKVPAGCRPDAVCIDGSERTACLEVALALPRPLTIVFDNWQQDYVYVDEKAREMMAQYKLQGRLYVQLDHTNHEGRPWTTAIWDLT